jgi:hypothetical protein
MYVYSRGGPQTALAPQPSLIYCAFKLGLIQTSLLKSVDNLRIKQRNFWRCLSMFEKNDHSTTQQKIDIM